MATDCAQLETAASRPDSGAWARPPQFPFRVKIPLRHSAARRATARFRRPGSSPSGSLLTGMPCQFSGDLRSIDHNQGGTQAHYGSAPDANPNSRLKRIAIEDERD
jgi:hypothetical protein